MKCQKCENIHRDPTSGMMVCFTCGTLIEESQIAVDALEFDDNQKAAGTFMDNNKPSYFYRVGRNTLRQMIDSSQRNLKNTFNIMERTAKTLTIPDNVVNTAKNIYVKASEKKFTQGRKTELLVGAILYLACRLNNTKHLLIDFSEALRINVFLIGSIYIKLVRIMGYAIEILDLSIFMSRFINKFNFGNKKSKVEKTALKILQFMERDWITYGRRPSGLCGACILISAKLHKLNVDINLISKVLRVSAQTILNRIEEFSLTRVASMSMEEFACFEEWHFYPEADPPAFLKGIKKSNNQKEQKDEEKTEEKIEEINKKSEEKVENGQTKNNRDNVQNNNNEIFTFIDPKLSLSKNNSFKNDRLNLRSGNSFMSKNNNYNDSFALRPRNSGLSRNNDSFFERPFNELYENNDNKNELFSFRPSNSVISKNNNDLSLTPNNSGINKSKRFNELKPMSTADEKLSNIPDNEDYKYIYSRDEYGVRKQLWEIMFKDWIEQQKEKEEKEGKEKKLKVKEPRKRIKKMMIKPDGKQKSAFEAIKSSSKFGKKINFSYIKSIMSKRKEE